MQGSRHFERGQTLPLVALSLIALFGFTALAVDAGYLEYRQRVQQTAADSAAIAGGWALIAGSSVSTAAQSSASGNGYTDNGTTVTVSATNPPATGPNSGNASAVEVNVTAQYPAIFSGVFGRSQNAVSTRAVAVVQSNPFGPCIWALNGNFANTNGSITGPCGMMVSNNVQNNGATISIPSIGAGGHVTNSPSGVVVSQNIPAFNDPCPRIPGCRAVRTMFPLGSTPGPGPYASCSSSAPASGTAVAPGCYPSLPDGSYTFSPGLYIFQGDVGKNGASVSCPSCTVGSSGVSLVIGGKVNLNGANMNLNAPPNQQGTGAATVTASGGVPGVLVYMTSTQTSPQNFSAQSLLGMIYAPNAHINLDGGRSTLAVTYVVAAEIIANGSSISIQSSSLSNPTQAPVLAE